MFMLISVLATILTAQPQNTDYEIYSCSDGASNVSLDMAKSLLKSGVLENGTCYHIQPFQLKDHEVFGGGDKAFPYVQFESGEVDRHRSLECSLISIPPLCVKDAK